MKLDGGLKFFATLCPGGINRGEGNEGDSGIVDGIFDEEEALPGRWVTSSRARGGGWNGSRGRKGVAAEPGEPAEVFLLGEGERRSVRPRPPATGLSAGRATCRWLGLCAIGPTTLERRRRANCSVPERCNVHVHVHVYTR